VNNLKEEFLITHITGYRNLGLLFQNWLGKAPFIFIFVHVYIVEQLVIHIHCMQKYCAVF